MFTADGKAKSARQLCEQNCWAELSIFAQKWHEENPDDHEALYYLGLALAGLNQFAQAEDVYRRALAIDASDARVWNNLAGLLYEHLHRPAEAVRCMEHLLRLNPTHKLAWSNLATMVGRMGQHGRAMAYADRAIALDPEFVEAYLHKGAAARALGKREVLKEVCRALASIEPEKFRRAR